MMVDSAGRLVMTCDHRPTAVGGSLHKGVCLACQQPVGYGPLAFAARHRLRLEKRKRKAERRRLKRQQKREDR